MSSWFGTHTDLPICWSHGSQNTWLRVLLGAKICSCALQGAKLALKCPFWEVKHVLKCLFWQPKCLYTVSKHELHLLIHKHLIHPQTPTPKKCMRKDTCYPPDFRASALQGETVRNWNLWYLFFFSPQLSPGYVGSGAWVQSIDKTMVQCHTAQRDKVNKKGICSFKTEIQHYPDRGAGWIVCFTLPLHIKHPGLAEVLSLQFTEITLQDFWILNFKSLNFLSTHTPFPRWLWLKGSRALV